MQIDLTSPGLVRLDSCYYASDFMLGDSSVFLLGADSVLHGMVQTALTRAGRVDAATLRTIHLDFPGHYTVIVRSGSRVVAATDPYGIIKLYWYRRGSTSVLTDSSSDLANYEVGIDKQALKYFLICGYTPSKHTFFENVAKLEPCRLYEFESGKLLSSITWARFAGQKLSGEQFLEAVFSTLDRSIDFYTRNYPKGALFLSGGIDSSFLYQLLKAKQCEEWVKLYVGRTEGLNKDGVIDNDFDIKYSQQLAGEDGREISIIPCEVSDHSPIHDFMALNENLFTEYAPAFALMGLGRGVPYDRVIINGQNADSILSFGSMGSPRLSVHGITGLHGLFSRYFHFFGHGPRVSVGYLTARVLRFAYYQRMSATQRPDFSDKTCLLGIGLQPQNEYFVVSDPLFRAIDHPEEMAEWFDVEYLRPLDGEFSEVDHHARAVILYNRTYMQGSANRTTVISALINKRSIFLPYASLSLLELMTCLSPDWRYAWYGKYPNISLGRRIGIPNYIIRRCDPNDADSTGLLMRALYNNCNFFEYMRNVLSRIEWDRYEGVLSSENLTKWQGYRWEREPTEGEIGFLLKMTWLETTMQKLRVA